MTKSIYKRTFLLAAVVLVLGAGSAQARPFGADEKLAYKIAVKFWGAEPTACASLAREVIDLPGDEGGHATAPPPGTPPASVACVLRIDENGTRGFGQLCQKVTHETGHLVGHLHSTIPRDVMYPAYVGVLVPDCRWERDYRAAVNNAQHQRYRCIELEGHRKGNAAELRSRIRQCRQRVSQYHNEAVRLSWGRDYLYS